MQGEVSTTLLQVVYKLCCFKYALMYFSDIDECVEGTHNCHANATCNNTAAAFNCSCQTGYMGNGTYCQG